MTPDTDTDKVHHTQHLAVQAHYHSVITVRVCVSVSTVLAICTLGLLFCILRCLWSELPVAAED